MAQPTTLRFGKFKIELGDGGTPEVFSAPCGFTSRGFERNKTLNESAIPDCDDPDAPVWIGTDVATISFNATGEGILAGESVPLWDDFFESTESRNIKVTMEFAAPVGTITYAGKAHLENWAVQSQQGQRVTASISLRGDGPLTRTPSL